MSTRTGPVRQALSELLAPLVATEGGAIYLRESADGALSLHWAGRYAGSPAAGLLHEEIALPLIQEIAPGTVVTWTSGRLIPADAELIVPRASTNAPTSAPATAPTASTPSATDQGLVED